MNRRGYLVLSAGVTATLAGCSDEDVSEESLDSSVENGDSPTEEVTETPSEQERSEGESDEDDDGDDTEEARDPIVYDLEINPLSEFEGDAIPAGADVILNYDYEVWSHPDEFAAIFEILVHDDGDVLDELSIEDSDSPSETEEFVVRSQSTELETIGYPDTDIEVEIVVTDTVADLESLPTSETFRSAGYTQSRYNQSAELLADAESSLDSGLSEYENYELRSLTDVTADVDFVGSSIESSFRSARDDASEALEYEVDPYVSDLEHVVTVAETGLELVATQRVAVEATDHAVEPLGPLIEREVSEAEESADEFESVLDEFEDAIEDAEDTLDSDTEYPVPVEEKVGQFRGELETLSSLHSSLDEISDGILVLENAVVAYGLEDYRQAQLDAGDAMSRFEGVLDDLRDENYVDETLDAYESVTNDLYDAAEDIREDAIDAQD